MIIETSKEVPMAGRFGKYGEAKRKTLIRKNRLRPPDLRQVEKKKMLKRSRKTKVQSVIPRRSSWEERNFRDIRVFPYRDEYTEYRLLKPPYAVGGQVWSYC